MFGSKKEIQSTFKIVLIRQSLLRILDLIGSRASETVKIALSVSFAVR